MAAFSASQHLADHARADLAALIDLQMSPLGMAAMDDLGLSPGQAVIDIGCGAGETLLQLADRVGLGGSIVGVDIAPRVLAIARIRAAHLRQVRLLQEDAATLALPDRSIDRVFSRFGTMFFADPTAAFINLHRMLRPGGRIGFVCWRSMQENELDYMPIEAAGLARMIDGALFSFEDAGIIDGVLRAAGFLRVAVKAHDAQVSCGDAETTLMVVTRVGALGRILRDTPALLPEAVSRVRAALSARERNGRLSLGAATWIVTATAG
jgi:SAM-dependent methyltransferase